MTCSSHLTTTETRLPDHGAYKVYKLELVSDDRTEDDNHTATVISEERSHGNIKGRSAINRRSRCLSGWDGFTTPPMSISVANEDPSLVSIKLRAFCWAIAGLRIEYHSTVLTIWSREHVSSSTHNKARQLPGAVPESFSITVAICIILEA